MPKICRLPLPEIQKIAAGEVVDRPVNVVKELVENAIDAKATRLIVKIEDGGKKLIRVIDNGVGMEPADARACFDHHATSKIHSVDDLQNLLTFGFRGEALSSIAAVSKVTLITKEEVALFATKVVVEASVFGEETQISANTGTDITIRDLFFNMPARSKFLKTRETEYRQILLLMQAIVIAYPQIHVDFYSDDASIFSCPANESLVARFSQLWDYTVSQQMIAIQNEDKKREITVEGIISRQHYMRYDRSGIFLFVNRRWVKNNHLMKALLKGYLNILPPARYPAAALFVTIDPAHVDINVHPRKEEVKFLHPQVVESLIYDAVKQALEQQVSRPQQAAETMVFPQVKETIEEVALPPFIPQKIYCQPEAVERTLVPKYSADTLHNKSFYAPKVSVPEVLSDHHEQIPVVAPIKEKIPYTIIGQYTKTYILVERNEQLVMLDQHAAHERILYELFAKRFADVAVVKLLFPLLITVSSKDVNIAEEHAALFAAHGLSVERFGEQQLRLLTTPVHLQERAPHELIKQIISWIDESENNESAAMHSILDDKIRAQMACAAAVKAGDELTTLQMEKLVEDLYCCENRITCPHGRPTTWQLDQVEIEKKFKRDYRGNLSIRHDCD